MVWRFHVTDYRLSKEVVLQHPKSPYMQSSLRIFCSTLQQPTHQGQSPLSG